MKICTLSLIASLSVGLGSVVPNTSTTEFTSEVTGSRKLDETKLANTNTAEVDSKSATASNMESQSYGSYEYNYEPENLREIVCTREIFPAHDFLEHNDVNRVYLYPARLPATSIFRKSGLDRYVSVFGLRIVVDPSVSDHQLVHLASTYAKTLDSNEDGIPDNMNLVEGLRNGFATLFVLRDIPSIKSIMLERTPYSFPLELQHCPLYFDFEESSRIIPGGMNGDATCSEGPTNKYDRTAAFILDHIFGRGYNEIFDVQTREVIKRRMRDSIESGIYVPVNTGCPLENEDCAAIMYMSWAMTTYHGYDECWCKKANALRLCDKKTLLGTEPELVQILEKHYSHVELASAGSYQPKLN